MNELNKGYEFPKALIAELESLRAENAKLKADVAAEVVQQIAEGEIWKELETLRARLAEIDKQEPVPYSVGNSYKRMDGTTAKIVGAGNGETVFDEEGCHYYNRASCMGRVTGTAHDFSYPRNLVKIYVAPGVSPDVAALTAENQLLKQQLAYSTSEINELREHSKFWQQEYDGQVEMSRSVKIELEAARKDAEHKQCQIDELILEFCPSEMTADQLNLWRKCQIPAIEQAKGGVK